jgi:uncharacterized protein YbjT (DUF2867 family)
MKIVVVGASGRIGEKLVYNLRQDGYSVFEASPSFGVNTVTGTGLAEALTGAEIVVDVSNSPSFEGQAALQFFETSGLRLLAAGRAARIGHHIALSVVGVDRLLSSDYFRAKKIQEDLIKASALPYTILRSTQFFELISDLVQTGSESDIVMSPALIQPIASEDVADTLADIVLGQPLNRTIEVAGPEQFRLDDLATEILTAYDDRRRIVSDVHARYFGAELDDRSLLPEEGACIASSRFEDWLRQTLQSSFPPPLAPRRKRMMAQSSLSAAHEPVARNP